VTLPVFSPLATADLQNIGQYIAKDNFQAALTLVDRLESRCKDAVANPRIGRNRLELQRGLRSLTEGDYVIFYRTLDSTIEIVRIVHGRRDLAKVLKKGIL